MELRQLIQEWSIDSTIDQLDLGSEQIKIPKLHHKYYVIYIKEKLTLEKLKIDFKELENIMICYYSGTLSLEEVKEYGLERLDLKVLKQDIPRFLDATPKIMDAKKQIATQQEKVEFVKSILDQIKGRSFVIRDAIEWAKFTQGA